jgi:hypothetical protein
LLPVLDYKTSPTFKAVKNKKTYIWSEPSDSCNRCNRLGYSSDSVYIHSQSQSDYDICNLDCRSIATI